MANGDPIRIGQSNFGATQTVLQSPAPTGTSVVRIQVAAGSGAGTGVSVIADTGVAVFGVNLAGDRPALRGTNSGGVFGAVWGSSPGVGVRGSGDLGVAGEGGTGVGGLSTGSRGVGVSGVVVDQFGQDAGSAGVAGSAEAGPGVDGRSGTGAGVRGVAVSGPGVHGASSGAVGVHGSVPGGGSGVAGSSGTGAGVRGSSAFVGVAGSAPVCGVLGEAAEGFGVYGRAQAGDGVRGESAGGWGVVGVARERPGVGARSVSGAGVDAASASGPGVVAAGGTFGVSASGRRVGLRGESATGPAGVHGIAARAVGVLGDGVYGVVGIGRGGAGVAATATGPVAALLAQGTGGARAGQFLGDVEVWGALTVTGVKAAAVPHPDGTLRRLHCLEGPTAMFEDVGEAELTDGHSTVALDPDFAALVDLDGYQVHLTPYGPVALYVARRDPESFEVAVVQSERTRPPADPVRFGWRLTARRRDVAADRLAVVDLGRRQDVRDALRAYGEHPAPVRAAVPTTTTVDLPPAPPVPPEGRRPEPAPVPRVDPAELDR